MKYVLAIAACVALAGCATSGMTDTLPKLSSKTSKSVTAYVQCVEPKWQALSKDAKGNAKDMKEGFTPLHWAAGTEPARAHLVKLLLASGADPNAPGGKTWARGGRAR